jgi:hypothetical protein
MKHGLVKSATDPGYGFVGPKTREKLAEIFGEQQAPSSTQQAPKPSGAESVPSPSPASAEELEQQLADLMRQVQQLTSQVEAAQ